MLRKYTPAENKANREALSRLVRIYKIAFGIPGLLIMLSVAWFIGYAMGYFDGYAQTPTILERNRNDSHD